MHWLFARFILNIYRTYVVKIIRHWFASSENTVVFTTICEGKEMVHCQVRFYISINYMKSYMRFNSCNHAWDQRVDFMNLAQCKSTDTVAVFINSECSCLHLFALQEPLTLTFNFVLKKSFLAFGRLLHESVTEIVGKMFYMVQIVHSNARLLYLWRQGLSSRFLRCPFCISFHFSASKSFV